MASDASAQVPSTADSGLFVRNATGLVREVKPWQAMAINFITGAPPFVIAIALFGALSGFPGGNFFVATLITIPLALGVVYAFGFLTAAIPRSGGDYVLVSRTLHPVAGVISSVCISLSSFLSIAFEALGMCIFGIAPGLVIVGLVGNHPRLVHWGNTVATSKWWEFLLGTIGIVVAGAAIAAGWTWAKRFMFSLLGLSILGLLISTLIALFTSKGAFIGHFNSFAQPYTHTPDTYHATIQSAISAGVPVHHAFSFSKTIPIIAVICGVSIFAYWSSFFAGELRQGNTLKTANRMGLASIAILGSVFVLVAIFFWRWGKDFLTAAFGGHLPSGVGSSGAYFVLTSAQVGNTAFAIFLVATFVLFWPVIMAETTLQPPRTMFAWSFDGIMPSQITKVTRRGVPITATAITVAFSILAYAWALWGAKNFFQVLVYATLIQLVTHVLVGVSAIVFPYRKQALYRASVSAHEVAGVPLMVVAGIGALITTVFLYWAYFHYPFFGLVGHKGQLFLWLGCSLAFGIVWYIGAKIIRAQRGVNIDMVYAEIPPE